MTRLTDNIREQLIGRAVPKQGLTRVHVQADSEPEQATPAMIRTVFYVEIGSKVTHDDTDESRERARNMAVRLISNEVYGDVADRVYSIANRCDDNETVDRLLKLADELRGVSQ